MIDSATEAVFATIPAGTPDDIDRRGGCGEGGVPGVVRPDRRHRSAANKLLLRVAEEL